MSDPATDPKNGNGLALSNKLLGLVLAALVGNAGLQAYGGTDAAADIRKVQDGMDGMEGDIGAVREVVTRTDGDGVPLVYVPRKLGEDLGQVVQELREIKEELRK